MKKFHLAIILFLAVTSVLYLPATGLAVDISGNEYVFGAHFASDSGATAAGVYDYTGRVLNTFSKYMKISLSMSKQESEAAVTQAFIDGKLDLALLYPYQIAEIIRAGGGVYPLLTYSFDNSRHMKYCFFQKAGAPDLEASDLQGMRLVRQQYNPFAYVQIRDFLFQLGVDKPLWQVFSSFTAVPSNNSAMMVVAAGKADVYWTTEDSIRMMKYFFPEMVSKVGYSLCTEKNYGHIMLAANAGTISKDEFEELRSRFGEQMSRKDEIAKEDPDFKLGLSYLRLEKGAFEPARRDQYMHELAIYERAAERGWDIEAGFISRKLRASGPGSEVKIEPDMDFCKEKCADNDCIVACLTDG